VKKLTAKSESESELESEPLQLSELAEESAPMLLDVPVEEQVLVWAQVWA
jgi:hypothetical protein